MILFTQIQHTRNILDCIINKDKLVPQNMRGIQLGRVINAQLTILCTSVVCKLIRSQIVSSKLLNEIVLRTNIYMEKTTELGLPD